MPFISICIPAYKRIDYLQRLLESIDNQLYRDFEVVVTDDSPDNSVFELVQIYQHKFNLRYFRNSQPLGTPENWNEGMRQVRGQWIKLMHDDDWFYSKDSLGLLANAAVNNPGKFIFCAYQNVFLDENRTELVFSPAYRIKWLKESARTLFSSNCIGPPSVVLHPSEPSFYYDRTIKWVVDIEYYMRRLKVEQPVYLDSVCVSVGMSNEQVTASCVHNPKVEIPENFYLLTKCGFSALNDWKVFDFFWRLMRNLEVRKIEQIRSAGYEGAIPKTIHQIVAFQKRFPLQFLKIGLFSKALMFFHFLFIRKSER